MAPLESMGKLLVYLGVLMVIIGGVTLLLGKVPGIGKIPGDIFFQRGNFTFYFPVVSSILLSLILTFILNLVFRR